MLKTIFSRKNIKSINKIPVISKSYQFSINQIDAMKHCIGFERSNIMGIKNRRMYPYKNIYKTSTNKKFLDDLVNQGLMNCDTFELGFGDNPKYYSLTEEGFLFLSYIISIQIIESKVEHET